MTARAQPGDRVLVDGAVSNVLEVRDDPIHGHLYTVRRRGLFSWLRRRRVIVDDDFRSKRAVKVSHETSDH